MSSITGQFSYEIQNLGIKNASFYLGKNDGVLYINDFDPIHPSEKDNLYWYPTEYRLKLVNNPDFNDINTKPTYPIPTTFDELIPNYNHNDEDESTTQNVWLYHPEFTVPNTIEYIKFYITEEEDSNSEILDHYKFYTLDSDNNLVPHTYNPGTIKKNNIEIKIKKDLDESEESDNEIVYKGTWFSMTQTYDSIKFKHNKGYDYKYKFRLNQYDGVLNNIYNIIQVIEQAQSKLSDITVLIQSIVNETGTNSGPIHSSYINTISTFITEINELIESNELLYRINDTPTDEDGYLSYLVASSNCSDIIGENYNHFIINYQELNLDLIERFFEGDVTPQIQSMSNIKMIGILNNYNDSEILTINEFNQSNISQNTADDIILAIVSEDLPSQSYDTEILITIGSYLDNVGIYYTLDESDPTEQSSLVGYTTDISTNHPSPETATPHTTAQLNQEATNTTWLFFEDVSNIRTGDYVYWSGISDWNIKVCSIDLNESKIQISSSETIPDGTTISFISPFQVTLTVDKYNTSFEDILEYCTNSILEIEIKNNIFNMFYLPAINFRKSYIEKIYHFDIFTINDYGAQIHEWFQSCDKSCLNSNLSVSMRKLKYTSNLSIINMMLTNIRNIYHIGELQEHLIVELSDIIQTYHTQTSLINVNDVNDEDESEDPITNTFKSTNIIQTHIIDEINKIHQFVVFNNSCIFSSDESLNGEKMVEFKFISSSLSNNINNNLQFIMPKLDSLSLNLNELNDSQNLYDDILDNQNNILNIYTNAINSLQSKTNTFNSLRSIIDLRLKTIIDFIEYTKNLLE